MKIFSKVITTIIALTMLVLLVSCSGEPTGKAAYDTSITGEGIYLRIAEVRKEINSMKASDFEPSSQESDYVMISVKDYGDIVLVLRRDIAPISVANFKKLVKDDFYNGTIFHRVVSGFMIQGGGFTVFDGKLAQKPADEIKGEFYENGVTNNLSHIRGVLSMARTTEPDSASSQFFIMHADNSGLNGKYAAFGYVLAGMDVVDKIAGVAVDDPSATAPRPLSDVIISSVSFVQPK